jgi:tRNA(fMet)-specific endonuclease VapC
MSEYKEENADALTQFLSSIDVLPFDVQAAITYGPIRADLQQKGKLIGALDMLIAAHAKSQNLILVTNNVREFERVKGLQIENWAE